MNIIQILIPADGYHISVQTFPMGKAVFFEGISFPFGKGMDDLSWLILAFDIKAYRAFYAIQIVIKAG